MSERRQHFRRRTLLDGRLEVAKLNGWALDCSVRNVSAGGARVTVPTHVVVPQHVGLAISGKPQRPAKLVWYRDGQAGFALVDERQADHDAQEDTFASGERRRAPDTQPVGAPGDRLAARVAAIAARDPQAGRFTRP